MIQVGFDAVHQGGTTPISRYRTLDIKQSFLYGFAFGDNLNMMLPWYQSKKHRKTDTFFNFNFSTKLVEFIFY